MGTVSRPGTETLTLSNCPCCGGSVSANDCGYSSFNPGWAQCDDCEAKWELGYVNDDWDSGERWNALARDIRHRLELFDLLKVNTSQSISRDFAREKLEDEAANFLDELRGAILRGETFEKAEGAE